MLQLKINFFKIKKYIIVMYFLIKNTLKNNRCRTLKHSFNKLVWARTARRSNKGSVVLIHHLISEA
jgi:hypothetical protein